MKVTDSITQSTTVVRHDPQLGYWNPNLMIVSHKATPALNDQVHERKQMPGLKTYLNQPAHQQYLDQPTGSSLSQAEYSL